MKIGPQDTWRPGIARFFLAGYASGEAMVKLWPRGWGQPRHVPGRGLERQPPRVASSVLVAVGLRFTVPDLDQPGGRVSAYALARRLKRGMLPGR